MPATRTDRADFPNTFAFRAFPSKGFGGVDDNTNHEGIDVLDWFATAAIGGVLSSTPPPMTPAAVATACYDIAEAMIAEAITRHLGLPI